MIKRTNINLDMDLVAAAATELGTERTTDTVHLALREAVDRARRGRLAGQGAVSGNPTPNASSGYISARPARPANREGSVRSTRRSTRAARAHMRWKVVTSVSAAST